MRTGEANTSAHNDENPSVRTHRGNLPPRREKVKSTAVSYLPFAWTEKRPGLNFTRKEDVPLTLTLIAMLLVTATDITVWIVSVLLALGIGASKYAKWKTSNRLVRELAAMDRERREKVLSRMNPGQAMEARQELMRRFNIF